MYRQSWCWYDVPQKAAIHESTELRLQPHDLLLLDYDVTAHQGRLDLSEEIVVAWVTPESGRDRKRRLEIGLMKHYSAEDEEAYFLETGRPLYRHSRDVRQVEANLSRRDPVTGKLVHLGIQTMPAFVGRMAVWRRLTSTCLHRSTSRSNARTSWRCVSGCSDECRSTARTDSVRDRCAVHSLRPFANWRRLVAPLRPWINVAGNLEAGQVAATESRSLSTFLRPQMASVA